MKSLFAKILLWFLATATIAVTGFAVIAALVDADSPRGRETFQQELRFHGGEAVHIYEESGPAALADHLARMTVVYHFNGALTDEQGRSLSDPSQDLSNFVERARRRRVFSDFPRYVLVFSSEVTGRQGQYWFFLLLPRDQFGFWARLRRTATLPHLWLLASVVLLSYALARYLTQPVKELRRAAERLGQGDFQARVRSTREDELGELAQTFDHMADRIERAVTAQQQLVQDVSHELRSPLSRLAVAVELARTSPDPAAALDRVEREAERLNELVGELLAVSRDQIRPEPVDFSALLAQVTEELQIEAQAHPCRLTLDAARDLTLSGDPELLRRAVENVTRNAIRYTSPQSEVRVVASRRGGQIEITVQDAGPGVPEEALPRLFDPFYRVSPDRDRSTGGVGLGLSIARRAVELHGGRIAAANTRPGLRVSITLPGDMMKKSE